MVSPIYFCTLAVANKVTVGYSVNEQWTHTMLSLSLSLCSASDIQAGVCMWQNWCNGQVIKIAHQRRDWSLRMRIKCVHRASALVIEIDKRHFMMMIIEAQLDWCDKLCKLTLAQSHHLDWWTAIFHSILLTTLIDYQLATANCRALWFWFEFDRIICVHTHTCMHSFGRAMIRILPTNKVRVGLKANRSTVIAWDDGERGSFEDELREKKELWARSKHCILCCASVQNAVHKMPTRRHKSINFWTWTLVPSFLFAYVHRESVHEPFLFMVPTKERHRASSRESPNDWATIKRERER